MKRANGTGTIYKLRGRRRKPYAVMITTGREIVDGKARVKRKLIGTYASRADAEKQLSMFVDNPYAMTNGATFEDVYNRFYAIYSTAVGESARKNTQGVYGHFRAIHGMRMADIRPVDIERCMANSGDGKHTKRRMMTFAKKLFEYAIKRDIVSVNQALKCDVAVPPTSKSAQPFTGEEVGRLWKLDVPDADLILMQIYTGMRAAEFYSIRAENVDLKRGIIMGGSKTAAGINRIVPIHSAVLPLFRKRYTKKEGPLFDEDPNYHRYRHVFERVCRQCGIDGRTTHSSRHTFASLAAYYGMNQFVVKRIMGHAITDVTEAVYTRRTIDQLKQEIELIPKDWWKDDGLRLVAVANGLQT